jgi:uncharacterized protein
VTELSNDETAFPLYPSTYIYADRSLDGLGVFARENISKGTLIETAPIYRIDANTWQNQNPLLTDYCFDCTDEKDNTIVAGLVWGFGSLFNHDDYPNIEHVIDEEEMVMRYYALFDIQKDEELFISYGNGYWDGKDYKVKSRKVFGKARYSVRTFIKNLRAKIRGEDDG